MPAACSSRRPSKPAREYQPESVVDRAGPRAACHPGSARCRPDRPATASDHPFSLDKPRSISAERDEPPCGAPRDAELARALGYRGAADGVTDHGEDAVALAPAGAA